MNEKLVAKALFKKLSALRATLSDEEQALLDRMVENEYDVEAHKRIQPAADERRATPDADEAEAHKRIQPLAGTEDDDEAQAHLRIKPAAEARSAFRVVYNPDDEAYNVE